MPPEVAFVIAHAASFLVRNSAFWRISISTGKTLASITFWQGKKCCQLHQNSRRSSDDTLSPVETTCTWIWALFPAVMLDTVQHASFLIDSLGLLRRWSKHGSAEQFKITWDDRNTYRDQMATCNTVYDSSQRRNHCRKNVYAVSDPLPESGCHLPLQCCLLPVEQEKPPYNHCAYTKHKETFMQCAMFRFLQKLLMVTVLSWNSVP